MKFVNKGRWTITGAFLRTLIVVVLMIFFINTVFIFTSFLNSTKISLYSPSRITLDFSKYIKYNNQKPYITEEGKRNLKSRGAWIQILGEDFKEKYSLNKPKGVRKIYDPITIVHAYKYDIKNYTMFIGESKNKGEIYSYLIGFPIKDVAKYIMEYNPSTVRKLFGGGLLYLFIIDIVIAILVAYLFFSKKMGNPLQKIIEGIKELSNGNYRKHYKEEGVYKNIFSSLNNLNKTLNENKIKRRELDKMRDNWISSISHDVKTPLSSIKGYAEIMKDTEYNFSDEEIKEYTTIIWDKASYIQDLIEELNLTYKLRNDLFKVHKDNVNIVVFLKSIIIEILNNPNYSDRDITFNCEIDKIMCFVNQSLFKRAIINLIINSVIHNTKEVKVDVLLYKSNNEICIEINDNGKGISKEDIPYIFERYYRGTNTSFSKEGSGLGLAIAKQIIEVHGGSLSLKSKLGVGTNIKIYFRI